MPESIVFFVAAFSICLLICWSIAKGIIPTPSSPPSERSLHDRLVARGGGLGIATVLIAFGVYIGLPTAVIAALSALWAISAWDDWSSAPASVRLSVHTIAAAAVAVLWLDGVSAISAIIIVISLIWCVNLFNFMDGADGIAASTAVIGGFGLVSLIGFSIALSTPMPFSAAKIAPLSAEAVAIAQDLRLFALVIASAALAFLLFNWPPARIFMGDGGSTVLGLSLAAISFKGWNLGLWPLAVPVALFVPFWADATYTLVRRVLAGHSPLVAHRDNLYQRLVLAGLGHRGLLVWIIAWNVLSLVVAIGLLHATALHPVLRLLLAVVYGVLYVLVCLRAIRMPPVNLLLNPRASFALLYDILAVAVAWIALFWMRFNFNFDDANYSVRDLIRSLSFVLPVHAVVLVSMGLYRGMWRFASLTDLWLIVRTAFAAAASTAVLFTLVQPDSFIRPRSVLLVQPFLLVVLMGGARLAYRSWREHRLYGLSAVTGDPVIVLGAGTTGARLVNELKKSEVWRAVALLDDDVAKVGVRLHDAPVLGSIEQTAEIAKRFGARHAIIAMPNAPHSARRRAATIASDAGLTTLTVPSYDELMSDNEPLARLRAVELDDLLGRDPVSLDSEGLGKWLSNQTVLVTGAGGSIGYELCTQIARFKPERLVMLDISEFAAHGVVEHIAPRLGVERVETYVADVRDRRRMNEIFATERPSVVFHAAAYKHVPLTEGVNAWEAVRNNVLGTVVAAQSARSVNAQKFVLVSTDKAVRASSVMGASKRLAELACMSFPETPTQFVGVRFGNVLGSNGSVIPKFKKQIDAGGPVTITHEDMTRFFMSIPEAAQLVLQAALIGDARSLYVLDMGEPVKIVDLARELIRLAKGRPDAVPITFVGLRPGEKMHEELIGDLEEFTATAHQKVRRVTQSFSESFDLDEVVAWLEGTPSADIRSALKRWVTDFKPPVV
jgi:FlaA1/EpsC-like NDP-sugar epimerase/UDP-N-acetylmuramyl pentapeptide phosphotransferase/UDP-N-acetylglucosamine-1-phosphate transferase